MFVNTYADVRENNVAAFTNRTGSVQSTHGGPIEVLGLAVGGHSDEGVGLPFQGTYGSLRLNADGTFTYRLDNGDSDTNLLAAGQIAEERFTYTYVKNGVVSTAMLVIRVSGTNETGQEVIRHTSQEWLDSDHVIDELERHIFTHRENTGFIVNSPLEGFRTLTNNGSIRSGSVSNTESTGVGLKGNLIFGGGRLVNNGLIEAISGAEGHGSWGVYNGSVATVENNGVIRAVATLDSYVLGRAIGIESYGHGSSIVNYGTIEAISEHSEAIGIFERSAVSHIQNYGLIYVRGHDKGDHPLGIIGIDGGGSSGYLIENSGTILVETTNPDHLTVGIRLFADSTSPHAYGTVVNSGTIVADAAIVINGRYSTGLRVHNSGRIEGSLQFSTENFNVVINEADGLCHGNFYMGAGSDLIINNGAIIGDVTMWDGADMFDGRLGTVQGLVSGNAGSDILYGGRGKDRLSGDDGADRIQGGTGGDQLSGGTGADVFVYTKREDSIVGGVDLISDFESGVDKIDISQLAPLAVTLNPNGAGTNLVVQLAIGNLVVRIAGTVTETDLILAPQRRNPIGTMGDDRIEALLPDTTVQGRGGDDYLVGEAGNNILDGGTGDDILRGGQGDDVYIVDAADFIFEFEGGGVDEVRTEAGAFLSPFVENLVLLGSAAISGWGNDRDNVITGNDAANGLSGQEGDDLIYGGGGADYIGGSEGQDIYLYWNASESNAAATDYIMGFERGFDRIDLSRLAPSGFKFETFYNYWTSVHYTTVTVETAGGPMKFKVDGTVDTSDFITSPRRDTVSGSARDDAMSGTLAGDVLRGLGGSDRLDGSGGRDELYGGAGTDRLIGGAGNDRLDGGLGADVLEGGSGNDVYILDQLGEQVIESAGGGRDTVMSFYSFVLDDTLEDLTLIGNAGGSATGNDLSNVLIGNFRGNRLDGKGGADVMKGGEGVDIYVVDHVGDKVIEVREYASAAGDRVETVIDYTLPNNVEILTLTGSRAIDGTGNREGNTLYGNDAANTLTGLGGHDGLKGGGGADVLVGGDGADTLEGGAGRDRLESGSGPDIFVFDTINPADADQIVDFDSSQDLIYLDDAFTGIERSYWLDATAFVAGTEALEADDRILYDSATGRLLYDADGIGSAAAVLIATLTPGVALDHLDFRVMSLAW